METVSQETWCRRRALRISLPIEALVQSGDRETRAVVRDISEVSDAVDSEIGIGLFHSEWLPLNQPLPFRTRSESSLLPKEAICILFWTSDRGAAGYLSGGRLYCGSEPAVEPCTGTA